MFGTSSGYAVTVKASVLGLMLLGICLGGCRGRADRDADLVFVAASFHDAVSAVADDTGAALKLQAAASSVLARQIVHGAQPACFLSAHRSWMDQVEADGLLQAGSRRTLVGNRLVVVVPKNAVGVGWDPATFRGRLVIGDPSHVPVGMYARQALREDGTWSRLAAQTVLAADASATLRFVERGEVDAGVVYLTDAMASRRVRVVHRFSGAPVQYEIATLVGADPRASRQLSSAAAMAVYARLGFELAPAVGVVAAPADSTPVPTGSALRLSLFIGLVATLIGLLPAMLLARWLARSRSPLRPVVEALVILPMVLPPVVVGYFLLVLFGRHGVLGEWLADWFGVQLAFRWPGAALAALIMGFPLMVRAMRQAFENVDPGLEQAAATLGASGWTVFRRITVPLAAPGLVAGAALCFARSLGEFGATITFAGNVPEQTRTLPLAIWTALSRVDGVEAVWQLTWLCVGVSVSATLLCELLVRRQPGVRREVHS